MKILWLCNVVLPEFCEEFGFKKQNMGGWLSGMWGELSKIDDIELGICVPIFKHEKMKDGKLGNSRYYSFLFTTDDEKIGEQQKRFETILVDFKPDIIHVWGTEYIHSFSMIQATKKLGLVDNVVINIQGLLTYYAEVYCCGLPQKLLKSFTSQENDVIQTLDRFAKKSEYEKMNIRRVKYVIGRTNWDRQCSNELNNQLKYFHCGEILRSQIYDSPKWNCIECNRHTIFLSQAGYPIKGLHMVINAFALLKTRYEDLKVVISGPNMLEIDSVYANYLKELIAEHNLQDTICFIGPQPVESMIKQYLASNVFLSPSLIENSSNSICEAMNLGVPVVASNVGGTSSLIDDGVNGLLYPLEESDKCVDLISQIFDDDEFASKLSEQAIVKGGKLNNRKEIVGRMIEIYSQIAGA